jgi:teichuronic acid biosynthesis glycosyltransferase TuaG
MPNELVSIITPMYNSEGFIANTIESVIAQAYTNWEMIIVDDCSNDNCIDIEK